MTIGFGSNLSADQSQTIIFSKILIFVAGDETFHTDSRCTLLTDFFAVICSCFLYCACASGCLIDQCLTSLALVVYWAWQYSHETTFTSATPCDSTQRNTQSGLSRTGSDDWSVTYVQVAQATTMKKCAQADF